MALLTNGLESLEVGSTAWRLIINANLEKLYSKTTIDNTFLSKTGGTLTGFLSLHSDPTSNVHAATKQYVDTKVSEQLFESTGVVTGSNFDLSTGNLFSITVASPTALTLSGLPTGPGEIFSFYLEINNGGSTTVTWFSGAKFAGGFEPNLTVAGTDIFQCYTRDGGTTWNILVQAIDIK